MIILDPLNIVLIQYFAASVCLQPENRGSVLHVFGHGSVGVGWGGVGMFMFLELAHMVDATS